tara:strand:- start:486 stop:950 length:465 start_codon:yes stop_codon:yes gene_type:complete
MLKWKEVNPYTGNVYEGNQEEDAPANSVAGGGVSLPPDVIADRQRKKKALFDARTKEYRMHREKLESQRKKRLERKMNNYIQENNVQKLEKIVKDKAIGSLKFKDGSMKVDLTTASRVLSLLKKVKPETRKKAEDAIRSGSKSQFMNLAKIAMK